MSRITVFLPVNAGSNKMLGKAIASFLLQKTTTSIELVCIVDENAKSVDIVEKYKNEYMEYIVILEREKKSLLEIICHYVKQSKTDFFCLLNENDFLSDYYFFQEASKYLEEHEDVICYFGNAAYKVKEEIVGIARDASEQSFVINDISEILEEKMVVPVATVTMYRKTLIYKLEEQRIIVAEKEEVFGQNYSWFGLAMNYGKAYYSGKIVAVCLNDGNRIVSEKIIQMQSYILLMAIVDTSYVYKIYRLVKSLFNSFLKYLHNNKASNYLEQSDLEACNRILPKLEEKAKKIIEEKVADGKPIVSFCISSYNRADMVLELVKNLIQYSGNAIEIIVTDDASTDNTCQLLLELQDSRIKVIRNEKNLGPMKNWYMALQQGAGTYLFQLLDRDWINIDLMNHLLLILEELDKQEVAFAVAGEKINPIKQYEVLEAGMEGLVEFALRDSHPTGMIFRKKEWDKCKDKEKYFGDKKYGVYSHGYIFALLAKEHRSAFVEIDICDKANYVERRGRTTSRAYAHIGSKDYWFLPSVKYNMLINISERIEAFIQEKEVIQAIIYSRYMRYFWGATWGYKTFCDDNDGNKRRYGCETLETNKFEILENGFKFIMDYKRFLLEKQYGWIDEQFMRKLDSMDVQMISSLYKIVSSMSPLP